MTKPIEYISWRSMKTRCNNPKHADYKNYGARGISYDPRWENFKEFHADMGNRPHKNYTLERKDHNGNYCKSNCIWLLKKYQPRNQRSVKLSMDKALEIRKRYSQGNITQKELAMQYGVCRQSIWWVVNNKKWQENL